MSTSTVAGTRLPVITTSRAMLRSKTGIAILKSLQGGFDDRLLKRRLCRITKDHMTEVRFLNQRKKVVEDRASMNMRKSQKLVETYSLPPIQIDGRKRSIGAGDHQRDAPHGNTVSTAPPAPRRPVPVTSSPRLRRTTEPVLEFWKNKEELQVEDIRQFTIGSPVPPQDIQPNADSEIAVNTKALGGGDHSMFPSITIEKCEDAKVGEDSAMQTQQIESLGASTTSETLIKRSKSIANINSNFSPVITRRLHHRDNPSDADKMRRQLTTFGFKSYKSEGNILDAIHRQKSVLDPRFVGLESILQPKYAGKTNSPTTLSPETLSPSHVARPIQSSSLETLEASENQKNTLDNRASRKSSTSLQSCSSRGSSPSERRPARLVPIQFTRTEKGTNDLATNP